MRLTRRMNALKRRFCIFQHNAAADFLQYFSEIQIRETQTMKI